MTLSPKEVKRFVANDLKAKSISRAAAAEQLGMKTQTLANLLSEQKYFSRGMALRFNQFFSYSVSFLMTGEGSLFPPVELLPYEEKLYSESIQRQKELNSPPEAYDPNETKTQGDEKSDEYYRSLCIDDLIDNHEWAAEDYEKAMLIREVYNTKIQDMAFEVEYTEKQYKQISEENKRLWLENMALRRKIQLLTTSQKDKREDV